MIETIYLDMDGVICDFQKRYIDLYKNHTDMAERKGTFGTCFTHFINTRQFETLEPMEDMKELIQFLDEAYPPVHILSSSAREDSHETISEQKTVWLKNHGIEYPRHFVPGKSLKYKYANKDSIIIDDTRSVIDDWIEAGGIAIWHKSAKETIQELQKLL